MELVIIIIIIIILICTVVFVLGCNWSYMAVVKHVNKLILLLLLYCSEGPGFDSDRFLFGINQQGNNLCMRGDSVCDAVITEKIHYRRTRHSHKALFTYAIT
jgi:hypothetical protein